ncbi:MAG: TetR/AcrR family transcriptional regulator [Myxococcota bacterium]|nr:TetR/AcrR family transcriptional regulator [Myxococcota bacterium]
MSKDTAETKGQRRRGEILRAAADLSTAEGLESLSLSRIAGEVGLTKPGVAAHFASKEALQLAVVDEAAEAYAGPLEPAYRESEAGLSRLAALAHAWLDHLDGLSYRGGCFFAAAGHDFSGRPGPVRDAVARHTREFLSRLEEQAALAARLGELRPDVEPRALAFTLHALPLEANLRRQLLDEPDAFELARRALSATLARASVGAVEEIPR